LTPSREFHPIANDTESPVDENVALDGHRVEKRKMIKSRIALGSTDVTNESTAIPVILDDASRLFEKSGGPTRRRLDSRTVRRGWLVCIPIARPAIFGVFLREAT
jgi:hypothetical protein